MQVIEIHNQFLQSASYIIGNYLIDCGDADKINAILAKNNIELKGIFLTHCHLDHIYGLPGVMKEHGDSRIICSSRALSGLKNEDLNLQYIWPELAFTFESEDHVVVLEEGLHILDDGLHVEVITTKGHSNDCQSYIIANNIFTGDAYIPGVKTFTKWPTSNKKEALISERRILELVQKRELTIRPGHWGKTK